MGDHGREDFRGKSTVFFAGTHTPLIVRWPKRLERAGLPPGTTSDALISLLDVHAATCELAGVEHQAVLQELREHLVDWMSETSDMGDHRVITPNPKKPRTPLKANADAVVPHRAKVERVHVAPLRTSYWILGRPALDFAAVCADTGDSFFILRTQRRKEDFDTIVLTFLNLSPLRLFNAYDC